MYMSIGQGIPLVVPDINNVINATLESMKPGLKEGNYDKALLRGMNKLYYELIYEPWDIGIVLGIIIGSVAVYLFNCGGHFLLF